MTRSDMPRLAELLAMLAETFNEPVSEVRAEGYYLGLEDVPIDAIGGAARHALQSCKFFPRPAELRDFACGTADDQSQTAWQALRAEVRRVGYIGTPSRLDRLTLDAVAREWGSWRQLCEVLPNDSFQLVAYEKRFRRSYLGSAQPLLNVLDGSDNKLLNAWSDDDGA